MLYVEDDFRNNKSMKNQGFSLLEVLIAMMVLAGTLVVLSSSDSGSVQSITKAQRIEEIVDLLESKLIEKELEYKKLKFSEMEKEDSGDFGSDFPDYRWTVQLEEFPAPDLSNLALQEEGQNEILLIILKAFSEHLQKSVMEMKVTVYWKVDDRELSYSVTHLLVDYDVPIQVAEGI